MFIKILLGFASCLVFAVVALLAWIAYQRHQWRNATAQWRNAMMQAAADAEGQGLNQELLDSQWRAKAAKRLPPPVQRYLQAVMSPEAKPFAAVHIRQTGTFNLSADGEQWAPFTADQLTVLAPKGFDWDARIRFPPGLKIFVRDAYILRQGVLRATLEGGIATLVDQPPSDDLSQGELMRFLAELPWYPPAALDPAITWKPIDDHSAQAELVDGPISVALVFRFGNDGLIESVRADARGRTVGDRVEPTPWGGRFWDYAEFAGWRVPRNGEVAWLLPDGPLPYWRGRLEEIEFRPVGSR